MTTHTIGVRTILVSVVATLLFVWVFLYRFNTLGGALGGFDNDHFLHFVHAKQVQAGEQPLRDFQDAGLQGARPSLTYELSAAAQRYVGNDLRSEAWLTVAGVAIGATVTFVAASRIAPWPAALLTALLSALVSPKLYGYPKVLSLAIASLLIVGYARTPTAARLVLLAAWTAIAFLFRHDYAFYCGAGALVAIALTHRDSWVTIVRRCALYSALTIVLLGPSLWWIEHYRGLGEYVRNAAEMGAYEATRTPLAWPVVSLSGVHSVADVFRSDDNNEAILYYLFIAIPLAGLAVAVARRVRSGPEIDRETVAIVAISVLALVADRFLLRSNLEARFGDVAPPVAVIAAVLLGAAARRDGSRTGASIARAALGVVVALPAIASIWMLDSVSSNLRTGKLLEPPSHIAERASRISQELAVLPAALRAAASLDVMEASDYLYHCTRPTDRVLIVGYAPEVPVFAERLFAGGRASFYWGFYRDERYSRETLTRLTNESVPIVLAEPGEKYDRLPLIDDFLRSHYVETGSIASSSTRLRVLIRRGSQPQGPPYGPAGRPCFA